MPEPIVLVVDDEPGIVQLCRRLLERANFRVVTTTEPCDSSTILEKEHFDLLLVDIRMPGMDGFQLIDLARNRQPDLAVVIMTGFGTVETAIEALRRGADSLVLKPFAGAELVQSVQRALKENQHKQDVLRLQTLRPLFAITESLYAETNPERLREQLVETVCGHLHCSYAGLYQSQTSENILRLITGRGDLPAEEDYQSVESLFSFFLASGAPVKINRDDIKNAKVRSNFIRHGFASVMVAPLTLKEGGSVLLAACGKEESAFRESDLEMFAIFARQASVALENARLHNELRAYIRQVEESQRALIQAEKMAITGRLTASIAHEINNPLQSVRNCLHLAGRKELSIEEQQNYLDLAQSELERLMNTVQRMLDYYRPGALDRKPVDINDLIQRVLQLVKPQLEEHKIHILTRFSNRLNPIFVVGDQIQQVLLNLVLNAMEAMPRGGKLYVETGKTKNGVEIIVEDTGPGVPAGERDRIFEPFISTKEGGTGLGLAVSYGIISAHGGNLDLVTGRGEGACFRIVLPAGEET